jgi:UPF0755 protein
VAAALTAVGVGLAGIVVYQHVMQPGAPGEPVKITIPDGASGKDIGKILAQNGLIEHELLFRLAVRLDKPHKPVKQGWYTLTRGSSALELLHILQQGSNRVPDVSEVPPDLRVTVPEGLSLVQASQLFKDPAAFVDAASDPALIARIGIKAKNLEGFLMPDTYFFEKKPTEREVVERMVGHFLKQYKTLVSQGAPQKGDEMLRLMTVASLVEKEAKADEERPRIAAVIFNRIEKNMPLQLDSTVQYALNKFGQRVLYDDLEMDSPYNTYKHKGLPPGPIASPGLAPRSNPVPRNTSTSSRMPTDAPTPSASPKPST